MERFTDSSVPTVLVKRQQFVCSWINSLVENPSYYGHLSGYENLAVFAHLLNVSMARIHEVLEIVRLTPAANKAVKGYSLGMSNLNG